MTEKSGTGSLPVWITDASVSEDRAKMALRLMGRMPMPRAGFTMVELTISIVAVTILSLAFGFILLQDQRSYAALYEHSLGDLREDSRIAALVFETLIRKATVQRERLNDTELEVYYYGDPAVSTRLDRYARFRLTEARELVVEQGPLDQDGVPLGTSDTTRLARQVTALAFAVEGAGVKMTLTLNQGSRSLTTTAAASRHN